MERFELELPLPPVEASPNTRVFYHTKARALSRYRQEIGMLALAAKAKSKWRAPKKARLSLLWGLAHVPPKRCRPRDPDNAVAAVKPLIDGLIDAGIIEDDNWNCLELGSVRATFDDGPWIRVVVEPSPCAETTQRRR